MRRITIECPVCRKNWDIDENDKQYQAGCPFCLSRFVSPADEIVVDSFEKAIYKILIEDGIETLKSKGRFLSLLMDKAPDFKKEAKMINKSCSQEILSRIAEWKDPSTNIASEAARLRTILLEDEGLSEHWADTICATFTDSLKAVRGEHTIIQAHGENGKPEAADPSEQPATRHAPKVVGSSVASLSTKKNTQKESPLSTAASVGTGSIADRIESFYQAARRSAASKESSAEDFLMDGNNLIRYKGCSAIVVIPNGTVCIETGVFSNNAKLTAVVMPDSLEEIKANAFYGCDALTTVQFSKNIKKLCTFSFRQCPHLKSVVIPPETQLEGSVFDYGVSVTRSHS